MCFSATASFGAALVVGGIGIVSLSLVRKKTWIPLGAIPLLFGVQQLQEGLLWRVLKQENCPLLMFLQKVSLLPKNLLVERLAFLFLFFAYVVWPTWIPFSFFMLEREYARKKILTFFVLFGFALSAYLLYMLIWHGASATIIDQSIAYQTAVDSLDWGTILYAIATLMPFFISSQDHAKLVGIVLTFSCLISYIYWTATFTSIWCFFAAILSISILLLIRKERTR